jgi:hypothetical protein
MHGTAHFSLSVPALAAGVIVGLVEAGCSTLGQAGGDDFANMNPLYERNSDMVPTVVASCLDDNPNPAAGCL